jgi:flagellar biosynthesis/type III secretory pathway protein FliH
LPSASAFVATLKELSEPGSLEEEIKDVSDKELVDSVLSATCCVVEEELESVKAELLLGVLEMLLIRNRRIWF